MNEFEAIQDQVKREIRAVELDTGQWLATSTDNPSIIGSGDDFEDAAVDLFDQLEQARQRGPRSH